MGGKVRTGMMWRGGIRGVRDGGVDIRFATSFRDEAWLEMYHPISIPLSWTLTLELGIKNNDWQSAFNCKKT